MLVYSLIVLMVVQVRSLRVPGVVAVIISYRARESNVVDNKFLATENKLKSASLIFSSQNFLAHGRWPEALEYGALSVPKYRRY